jgi:predicted porin
VAAAGAFAGVAGTAAAQSSVTVYGLLDVGYVGANVRAANNSASAGAATNAQTGNNVTKTTSNAFADSAESTSRLGFRGTEDIGGGVSAYFVIETAITPNTQNSISASTTTANRQTFLGLKKNGIGQAAIGTQYTTVHDAVAVTDPGQANNIMGNVIYDKVSGQTQAAATQQYSGQQNNTAYTVRSTNMLKFNSDTMAGFKVNAFYVLNNSNTTQTQTNAAGVSTNVGGMTNNTGYGLGIDYTWKALAITANYQTFKAYSTPATLNNVTGVPTATTVGYFGGSSIGGTNVTDRQGYVAATYDFGIVKAYLQYVTRTAGSNYNVNYGGGRSAEQIGLRSFITPTIESWVSGGVGKEKSNAGANANFGGWQVGSNYFLSKRTNLYAIYGQSYSSNGQFGGAPVGSTTTSNMTSYNGSNYAVGVRHTF